MFRPRVVVNFAIYLVNLRCLKKIRQKIPFMKIIKLISFAALDV
jgi:hypothetical protein